MVDPSQSVDSGFGFLTDLIGIQMRNMEAIRQAQQKMLEGMGVFAKRQTEIIEGTLRRSVSEPSAVTSPDIRSVVGHQIESLKTTILENQANSNILSEMAARSSRQAPPTASRVSVCPTPQTAPWSTVPRIPLLRVARLATAAR